MRQEFVNAGRLAHPVREYIVNNSVMNGTITVEAPYPTHIRLKVDAAGTRSGKVILDFEDAPEDGELLYVTVEQPPDLPGNNHALCRVEINIAGTLNNPGAFYVANSGGMDPDPHASMVTTFQLMYHASGHYWVKLSEGVTPIGPVSYVYDWTERYFQEPQKTDALLGPWRPVRSEYDSENGPATAVTNPVYIERTSGPLAGGACCWVSQDTGTNQGILYFMLASGVFTKVPFGVISPPKTLAVRENAASDTIIQFKLGTVGGSTYSLIVTVDNTGQASVTTLANTALPAGEGGVLYKDKYDDAFYWYSAGDVYRQSGGLGGAPASIHTTAGTTGYLARSSTGRLGLTHANGGNVYFNRSLQGLGVAVTAFGADVLVAGGGISVYRIAFDRVRNRWLILLSNGKLMAYEDDTMGAWTEIADLNNVGGINMLSFGPPDYFGYVGNLLVWLDSSANGSFCAYSVNGGTSWKLWHSIGSIGSFPVFVQGFCYLGGYLVASAISSANEPKMLVSADRVNRWGPFDQQR